MKKVLFFLICVCLVFVFIACTSGGEETAKIAGTYEIAATVNENTLNVVQTTTVNNNYGVDLDKVVFNLYANAYMEDIKDRAYAGSITGYGGIELLSVKQGEATVAAYLSENSQHVTVPITIKKNKSAEITFEYTVTLPQGAFRLGIKNDTYNLANFYPQLAVFENGAFRTDSGSYIGDPLYSDIADYNVALTLSEEFIVGASGELLSETAVDGQKTHIFAGKNMRDFALVASKEFNLLETDVGSVKVKYLYKTDNNAESTLETAANALRVFSENFGAYPHNTYTVARVPFIAGGMEFSGLVYISDTVSDTKGTVIHETAHQWWYGIVGFDGINAAFIDEGLTTFSSAYYYKLTGENEAFDAEIAKSALVLSQYKRMQSMKKTASSVPMNLSIYKYSSYEYSVLCYDKSAMMFKNLFDLMGQAKMTKALKELATKNRFRIVGINELTAAFSDASKMKVGGIINGWIGAAIEETQTETEEQIA